MLEGVGRDKHSSLPHYDVNYVSKSFMVQFPGPLSNFLECGWCG